MADMPKMQEHFSAMPMKFPGVKVSKRFGRVLVYSRKNGKNWDGHRLLTTGKKCVYPHFLRVGSLQRNFWKP
jgi:hypothetical protein